METILLVEDEPELARAIIRELEAEGYNVEHAADGPAALDAHAGTNPDLVILDWMLPGLDGLEVLRRIRQTSATPVLMLTARGEEMDRVIGLEVGADDYLTKPFSMRELIARVRALPVHRPGLPGLLADHLHPHLDWPALAQLCGCQCGGHRCHGHRRIHVPK